MKFHDMPYERVDFDQVEKAFEELKKSFAAAERNNLRYIRNTMN